MVRFMTLMGLLWLLLGAASMAGQGALQPLLTVPMMSFGVLFLGIAGIINALQKGPQNKA